MTTKTRKTKRKPEPVTHKVFPNCRLEEPGGTVRGALHIVPVALRLGDVLSGDYFSVAVWVRHDFRAAVTQLVRATRGSFRTAGIAWAWLYRKHIASHSMRAVDGRVLPLLSCDPVIDEALCFQPSSSVTVEHAGLSEIEQALWDGLHLVLEAQFSIDHHPEDDVRAFVAGVLGARCSLNEVDRESSALVQTNPRT